LKKTLKSVDKLQLRSEFNYVRENGRVYVSKYCLVVIADSPDELLRGGVICSKKYSKRAVKRNLLKRRIKEAYRLNKSILTEVLRDQGVSLDVIFIYTQPEILSYRDIEEKIVLSLRKILKGYEKDTD